MARIIILLFLLAASPSMASALQCYQNTFFMPHDTVTSNNLPSLNDSTLVSADVCIGQIDWNKDPLSTYISLSGMNDSFIDNPLRESILTNVKLGLDIDGETIISTRSLMYTCSSVNTCNNRTILQRLLESMIIEDSFLENLPEMITQMPFDNKTAATCLRSHNITSRCAEPDLNSCKRCVTNVYRSHSNIETICATCDAFNVGLNNIRREAEFLLDNRTRLGDRTTIECQREGCNSVENIGKIRQASTLTLDFDKLLGASSSITVLPSVCVIFTILFLIFPSIIIY